MDLAELEDIRKSSKRARGKQRTRTNQSCSTEQFTGRKVCYNQYRLPRGQRMYTQEKTVGKGDVQIVTKYPP